MTTRDAAADLNNTSSWLHRRISFLVSGFMFFSVFLRSVLIFQNTPLFDQILPPLIIWLLGLALNIFLGGQHRWLAVLSIGMEIFLTEYLLLITQADFLAFLFAIPCMQVMQQFARKIAITLVILTTLLTWITLLQTYSISYSIGTAVLYFGGSLLLVTYIGSVRRAYAIEEQQVLLVKQIQQANDQLASYSRQMQHLAAGRERQRLARELHDSVTQTIFSMTLTTQSALMLLDRDRDRVAVLLDRLGHLTQNALTEMQILISRLTPETWMDGKFITAIQEYIAERSRLDDLSIQFEIKGDQPLSTLEEKNLFRIVQEGLNNVLKHAGVMQAAIRLHLDGQPCLEIEDHGSGFDSLQVHGEGGMGLSNMNDRAREIGWTLQVDSSPGHGTRIRIWKGIGE